MLLGASHALQKQSWLEKESDEGGAGRVRRQVRECSSDKSTERLKQSALSTAQCKGHDAALARFKGQWPGTHRATSL